MTSPVSDDGEIVTTRVFGAPREAVYAAFADPARLARWWGPEGCANVFEHFDPRPGGEWRFVMRTPDGAEYPMRHRFAEVVPAERVVFDHLQEGHDFRLAMDFADEAGGTRLTWRMRFASAEEGARVGEFVAAANEQNFDRLARELGGTEPAAG